MQEINYFSLFIGCCNLTAAIIAIAATIDTMLNRGSFLFYMITMGFAAVNFFSFFCTVALQLL
jgi:hypothetical protein